MGAEGGDWSVDCSDDESYGLAYSELVSIAFEKETHRIGSDSVEIYI